jgi:hypothetical protein
MHANSFIAGKELDLLANACTNLMNILASE